MNDKMSQLEKRLSLLEKEMKDRQSSNTLPLLTDQALTGRGYLKNNGLYICGTTTLNGAGVGRVSLPKVSKSNIALATYNNATGSDIGCIIHDDPLNPGDLELYISGLGLQTVFFIVFLGSDINQFA